MRAIWYSRWPLLVCAFGCSSQEAGKTPPPHEPPVVRLVMPDSSTDETGTTYVWYRVVVHSKAHHDTLRGVLTHEYPLITPEGDVLGISFDSGGTAAFAYRYTPATQTLQRSNLPSDLSAYFSEAAFSPEGQHLAYVGEDSASNALAVIRAWPSGAELFHHHVGPGFPSDVNFNHLRWRPDGQAEFAIRVEDGPWVHIVASISGAASIDTLAEEPAWRRRGLGP